jgi:hypothetical protein
MPAVFKQKADRAPGWIPAKKHAGMTVEDIRNARIVTEIGGMRHARTTGRRIVLSSGSTFHVVNLWANAGFSALGNSQ